jgi:hypothetical protein
MRKLGILLLVVGLALVICQKPCEAGRRHHGGHHGHHGGFYGGVWFGHQSYYVSVVPEPQVVIIEVKEFVDWTCNRCGKFVGRTFRDCNGQFPVPTGHRCN